MKDRYAKVRPFVRVIQLIALDGTPVKVKQTNNLNYLRIGNNPTTSISDSQLRVLTRTKNLQKLQAA